MSLKKAIKSIREAQDGVGGDFGLGGYHEDELNPADQSDFDIDDSETVGPSDNYFDLKIKYADFNS